MSCSSFVDEVVVVSDIRFYGIRVRVTGRCVVQLQFVENVCSHVNEFVSELQIGVPKRGEILQLRRTSLSRLKSRLR